MQGHVLLGIPLALETAYAARSLRPSKADFSSPYATGLATQHKPKLSEPILIGSPIQHADRTVDQLEYLLARNLVQIHRSKPEIPNEKVIGDA
jgi:hypothetical protein